MTDAEYYNYLDGFYQAIYDALHDKEFDISAPFGSDANYYNLINILRDATHCDYCPRIVWDCAYLYLQRLRREHIVVFSAVRQEFDPDMIEDVISGTDLSGFTVMMPKYHGRYDEFQYRRHHNTK